MIFYSLKAYLHIIFVEKSDETINTKNITFKQNVTYLQQKSLFINDT